MARLSKKPAQPQTLFSANTPCKPRFIRTKAFSSNTPQSCPFNSKPGTPSPFFPPPSNNLFQRRRNQINKIIIIKKNITMGLNKTLVLILSLSCLIIHTIAAVQDPSAARRGAWRRKVGSPQIMVMNLCRNTTNSPLCVKTIMPSIKAPFTQFKALEAEMLAAKDVTLKTKGKIQNLLLDPKNSKDLRESLNICQEQFGNILSSIKEALVSAQARDPLESRMKFSAVISNLESCRDLFTKGVNPSPIGMESSLLSDLGANCLDISKKIEDQQLMRVMKRFGGKLPPPPPSAYSSKNDPCFGVIGICSTY